MDRRAYSQENRNKRADSVAKPSLSRPRLKPKPLTQPESRAF